MENKIELLAKVLRENDLTKVSFEDKDMKIVLEKGLQPIHTVYGPAGTPAAPSETQTAPEKTVEAEMEGEEVRSPLAGIYYGRPSPESTSFVKEGSRVKAGDTLCIVESMKIMNEIKAPFDLTILKILKKDEEVAEYNEPLFLVER